MENAPISQAERLQAAARIKAIGDGDGPWFDAADAEALHALLYDLPEEGSVFSFTFSHPGSKTRGAAAGLGNVEIEGDKVRRKWAFGEKDFRCGAYVVTRRGDACYRIRHAGEVEAGLKAGFEMELERGRSGWTLSLNKPWQFDIGFAIVTIGGRYVRWKRSR